MSSVIVTPAMRAIMTTVAADATTFRAAVAHLFQNPITLTPNLTLAALTEATFGGYEASATISWNGPGSDEVGNAYLFGPQLTFIGSSTTTPNNIYGGYLTGSGADSATLLQVDLAAAPIPVVNIGDFVTYTPNPTLPGPGTAVFGGP